MLKFKKLLFPVVAAVAATVAWAIDPSAISPEVAAGAWVIVYGVFQLKNKPA